jgi:hypothetical protein
MPFKDLNALMGIETLDALEDRYAAKSPVK